MLFPLSLSCGPLWQPYIVYVNPQPLGWFSYQPFPIVWFPSGYSNMSVDITGVDHGGMRGCIPPYKGDAQMKSILHSTQIITPEEIVSYIDDEIIFSRKFE